MEEQGRCQRLQGLTSPADQAPDDNYLLHHGNDQNQELQTILANTGLSQAYEISGLGSQVMLKT